MLLRNYFERVGMLLLVPAYRLYQSAVAVSISRVSIIYAPVNSGH